LDVDFLSWSDARVKQDLFNKLPEGARIRFYQEASTWVGEVTLPSTPPLRVEALGYSTMLRDLWLRVARPVVPGHIRWVAKPDAQRVRVSLGDDTALPSDLDPVELAELVEKMNK